jgi:hypothetical protein
MSTKRSISLLLMILFLMGCAIMGRSAEDTTAPDAEEPAEAPRELATSEQPLEEEERETSHSKRSPDDWELLYLQLKYQIEEHEREHPKKGIAWWDHIPYVEALDVFAEDRGQAFQYAQEAQAEGNDYYFNKFMDLEELAEYFGNHILDSAGILFGLKDYTGWANWCSKAEDPGKPIFDKAKERHFDKSITQKQIRKLLQASLEDLEHGYEYLHGELWDDRGRVNPQADACLEKVGWVRELADYFELDEEYQDATELMNRYLKDALCLLPKGHQWYLDLAKQYDLEETRKHIEGFYATVFGKVEVQRGEEREPAPGASVRVYAPKDDQEWKTTANEDGEYKIERVLLHKDCEPFEISAEYKGDRVDDRYDGPLEEPNTEYEFEKDLLIAPKTWKGTLTGKKSINWEGSGPKGSLGYPWEEYIVSEASVTLDFEVSYSRSRHGGDFYEDVVTASGTFVSFRDHTYKQQHTGTNSRWYWRTDTNRMESCSGNLIDMTVKLVIYEGTKQYGLSITAKTDTLCPFTYSASSTDPAIGVYNEGSGELTPRLGLMFVGVFEGGDTISGMQGEPVGEERPDCDGIFPCSDSAGSEWTWVLTKGED